MRLVMVRHRLGRGTAEGKLARTCHHGGGRVRGMANATIFFDCLGSIGCLMIFRPLSSSGSVVTLATQRGCSAIDS